MNAELLNGCLTYLAGPIDCASDDGIGWRRNIREQLEKSNINLVVLDPTDKVEGLLSEVKDEKDIIQKLKADHKWEELRIYMRSIVRGDLRMVDICDFLIAYIDKDIHMCGTYHEIIEANRQKKPVLLIIKDGKERCPSWLFGIVHYDFMFDNIEDCVDYINKVNNKAVELDNKWVFMREGIDKLRTLKKEKANATS